MTQTMTTKLWLQSAAALLLMFQSIGCGGPSDTPDVGTVTGTITMDGAPLEGVEVQFNTKGARSSFATTDASGTYELNYIRDIMGAAIGNHTVSITTPDEGDGSPPEPIPATYNSESVLSADVKAGENVFDFALKSSGD